MVYNTQTVGLPVSSSQDKARYIWNLPLAFYSLGHEQQEENGIHVVCLMIRFGLEQGTSEGAVVVQHSSNTNEEVSWRRTSVTTSHVPGQVKIGFLQWSTVPLSQYAWSQVFPSITPTDSQANK